MLWFFAQTWSFWSMHVFQIMEIPRRRGSWNDIFSVHFWCRRACSCSWWCICHLWVSQSKLCSERWMARHLCICMIWHAVLYLPKANKIKFHQLCCTFLLWEHIIHLGILLIPVVYDPKACVCMTKAWQHQLFCRCCLQHLYEYSKTVLHLVMVGIWKFLLDIYQINVQSSISQISTLLPVWHGSHMKKGEVCILHGIASHQGFVYQTERTPKHNYALLWNHFIQELLKSDSNIAGCKWFITGTFIAYPERYVANALVIDTSLISTNSQVLISVKEQNICDDIAENSSIHIHHISGMEYSCLRQKALNLGARVVLLHGHSSVWDKKTKESVSMQFGFHMDLMAQCILLDCMLTCLTLQILIQSTT